MPRNLDLTALRSFVAVADTGGVTRAAGFLHLTQSAVSMQLKRLEEAVGLPLIDRSGRTVGLTAAGEQLLGYARRMLALNDEVWGRLTATEYEGEIVLGVPHDILQPTIPEILHRFYAEYPRMRVQLISSYTTELKAAFARGEIDLILTTEDGCDTGGETLAELPLVWIGAPGSTIWRQRPLRLGFCRFCVFRAGVVRSLDAAGIDWELAVESESDRTIEATICADLAITAMLEGTEPALTAPVQHGGALPTLASKRINLYVGQSGDPVVGELEEMIRAGYHDFSRRASQRPSLSSVAPAAG